MTRAWGEPLEELFDVYPDQIIIEDTRTPCRIVGDLAIHNDLLDNELFTITHIPTLTCFIRAFPSNGAYTIEELIRWCQKVQNNHQSCWLGLRALTPDNYKGRMLEQLKLIQEWCLTVEV